MFDYCDGCEEEFYNALDYQDNNNLCLVQSERTFIEDKKKHLLIMMVNNKGKIIIE